MSDIDVTNFFLKKGGKRKKREKKTDREKGWEKENKEITICTLRIVVVKIKTWGMCKLLLKLLL